MSRRVYGTQAEATAALSAEQLQQLGVILRKHRECHKIFRERSNWKFVHAEIQQALGRPVAHPLLRQLVIELLGVMPHVLFRYVPS